MTKRREAPDSDERGLRLCGSHDPAAQEVVGLLGVFTPSSVCGLLALRAALLAALAHPHDKQSIRVLVGAKLLKLVIHTDTIAPTSDIAAA